MITKRTQYPVQRPPPRMALRFEIPASRLPLKHGWIRGVRRACFDNEFRRHMFPKDARSRSKQD